MLSRLASPSLSPSLSSTTHTLPHCTTIPPTLPHGPPSPTHPIPLPICLSPCPSLPSPVLPASPVPHKPQAMPTLHANLGPLHEGGWLHQHTMAHMQGPPTHTTTQSPSTKEGASHRAKLGPPCARQGNKDPAKATRASGRGAPPCTWLPPAQEHMLNKGATTGASHH